VARQESSLLSAPNCLPIGARARAHWLPSGVLLGGLIRTSHAKSPPFEDDPHAVGLALQRLVDSGLQRFYMGHGGPLAATEVRRHAQALMAKKKLISVR